MIKNNKEFKGLGVVQAPKQFKNKAFGAPGGSKPLFSLLFWINWRTSDEKPNIIFYFL
jgi:hypothetical protein